MANITTAKKIGYKQAFKAITIGLGIAYAIMVLESGDPLWIFDFEYTATLLFSALVLYGMGYVFGGMAGRSIILKRYPSVLIGIISGFLIIWSATFVGSIVGFITEGLPNNSGISEPFEDYILKPILTVSVWGFLPIVGIGIWYGLSIKRRGMQRKSA